MRPRSAGSIRRPSIASPPTEAPVETRAGSEEFSKADLAATYATLNRTTAIPAVYVPPAQTQEPENVERWAKTMEAPGGMSKVSQDITDIEQGFSDDRKETLRIGKELTREATQLKRAEARQGPVPGVPVPAAPAAPEPKPTRVGGDPELGAAPQRGGAGGRGRDQDPDAYRGYAGEGQGQKEAGRSRRRYPLVVRHVIIFGYGHGLQRAIIDESQHRTPERLVMAQH